MNISKNYRFVYCQSPVQVVETVREPIPPVTEYVLHLTPKAATALNDLLENGRWPNVLIDHPDGQSPGELLSAIRINLDAALRERP